MRAGFVIFLLFFMGPTVFGKRIKIHVFELFSVKIDHTLFNFTADSITDKFKIQYRPSLQGYPDLPNFMTYRYSEEHRAGFLYGTPTDKVVDKSIKIEIVALNRQNFETRICVLSLDVVQKPAAKNIVKMKIDNLDWFHLMDPGRIENLKNIFRKDLWPESVNGRLQIVFLESAIKMGNRLPASPQLKEGVIVHLGSNVPFSQKLKDLQDEVKPLYKMSSCNFKRTSVQTIFEAGGFKLDWCAFKISSHEENTIEDPSLKDDSHHGSELVSGRNIIEQWNGMHSWEAPERNYIDELAFCLAIPGIVLALLVGILSGILCFYHDSVLDEHWDYFMNNVFHICTDYRDRRKIPATVVHFSDSSNNQPRTTTTTLKSLRDAPGCVIDDLTSQSPSPSYGRDDHTTTPISSMRPKPPPYNKNQIDHRVLFC